VQLVDAAVPSYTLDVFGRCRRERGCDAPGAGGGLAQALHLINSEALQAQITAGVREVSAREAAAPAAIDTLYLRALGRLPDAPERTHWLKLVGNATGAERAEVLEDLLWALLNSREFSFVH
jgi:hypothetical protein